MLILLLLILGSLVSCILWSSISKRNDYGEYRQWVQVESSEAMLERFDTFLMPAEWFKRDMKKKAIFLPIPTFGAWIILVNRSMLIDVLAKATEELSFSGAVAETLQTDYSLGKAIRENPFHVDLIRSPLTRSVGHFTPEIHRLVEAALGEYINTSLDVAAVSAFGLAKNLVQRVSSRLLVGPLSNQSENLNVICDNFTNSLIKASHLLRLFPRPLRHLALCYFSSIEDDIQAATNALNCILSGSTVSKVSESREQQTYVEMLVSAQRTHSPRDVAIRLLAVKMTADHSTTQALTHLLFDLALHPNEVAEIRLEVGNAVADLNWTPSAFKAMRKLDSFIKESQRLSAHGAYTMVRRVVKDFTFPDGTVIPAGSTIAVPGLAINASNNNYVEAHKFKGFRFAQAEDSTNKDLPHMNPQHMVFGYGRHACPGRIVALQILKSIAAHLVLHYELELEGGRCRPPDLWIGAANVPNAQAKIRLRRRGDMLPLPRE